MKKYEVKKEKQSVNFYQKILFSVIIFGVVVTLCKINPKTSSYVKDVLNNSYNFSVVEEKTNEIINNIKSVYKNIEQNLLREE